MASISKLRLRNFKSFKKAELPLDSGFTVIAGANGTGKSNIMDALLFGLGITSLKLVRAKKLVDLVNHSAEDNTARVDVVLKDKGKEYEITRTIDRQGRSVFRLQGKASALNEIASLLVQLGIKPHGYNLVVQGDITRIIEMSPEERRGIIDDVAGLSEFDSKKEEALGELEKVERKIKDVRIVLNERESYLDGLEAERESAMRYKELTERLKSAKATILHLESETARKMLESASRRIAEHNKEIEKAKAALEKSDSEEKALKEKLDAVEKKISSLRESAYEGIGKEVEEKRANVRVCEERVLAKEHIVKRLNERIRISRARANELKNEISEMENSLKERSIEIGNLEREIGKIERLGEGLKESERLKAEERKQIDSAGRTLSKQIAEKQEILFGRKAKIEGIRKEVELIAKELARLSDDSGMGKAGEYPRLLKKLSARLGAARAVLKAAGKTARGDADAEKGLEKLCSIEKELGEIIAGLHKLLPEIDNAAKAKELSRTLKAKQTALNEMIKADEKAMHELSLLKGKLKENDDKLGAIDAWTSSSGLGEKTESLKEMFSAREKLKGGEAMLNAEIASLGKRLSEISKDDIAIENEMKEHRLEAAAAEKEKGQAAEALKELEIEYRRLTQTSREAEAERESARERLNKLLLEREAGKGKIDEMQRAINDINIEKSRNEVRVADLSEEAEQYKKVRLLDESNVSRLKDEIPKLEEGINGLGAINMKAIENYDSYKKEVDEVRGKADILEKERLAVLDMIDKIEVSRKDVFMDAYNKINSNFSKIYYSFFDGEGRLSLSNEEDIADAGLIIEARHKSERMNTIDVMSGGERALTALAFLFAIQMVEAAPFYFFDEADAALDKDNSEKLVRMIRDVSKQSQFIAITHNDSLIRGANQIVGVALNEQKSSVIGLKLREEFEKVGERGE